MKDLIAQHSQLSNANVPLALGGNVISTKVKNY